uniref:Uncharacterized protein n=1 Tax=Anguilla anguilla TaxID=7936 RepID=A0A0E9SWM8_ANGAN
MLMGLSRYCAIWSVDSEATYKSKQIRKLTGRQVNK